MNLRRAPHRVLIAVFAMALIPALAFAQFGSVPQPDELVKIKVEPVSLEAGGKGEVTVTLTVAPTWHINANPPFPDYMIPTELEITPAAGVTFGEPVYPAPHMVKLGFDDSDLFVYDGEIDIVLPTNAAGDAINGTHTLSGKLKFQACDDQVCLAPTSLPVSVVLTISGGVDGTVEAPATDAAPTDDAARAPPEGSLADGGTLDVGGQMDTADDAPAPSGAFSTGPPPDGAATAAAIENPIAKALEQGSLATFVTLFLIGLALNLTPCVYPMLGVTVSIFGARGQSKPIQAFGMALIYVLGIAVMYSVLGVVAAFSGGLFGAALQNPIVLLAIGGLLIALSLSMFGMYELQLPSSLMSKLGGQTTTGAVGVFPVGPHGRRVRGPVHRPAHRGSARDRRREG